MQDSGKVDGTRGGKDFLYRPTHNEVDLLPDLPPLSLEQAYASNSPTFQVSLHLQNLYPLSKFALSFRYVMMCLNVQ
jgi:hypothetical protein